MNISENNTMRFFLERIRLIQVVWMLIFLVVSGCGFRVLSDTAPVEPARPVSKNFIKSTIGEKSDGRVHQGRNRFKPSQAIPVTFSGAMNGGLRVSLSPYIQKKDRWFAMGNAATHIKQKLIKEKNAHGTGLTALWYLLDDALFYIRTQDPEIKKFFLSKRCRSGLGLIVSEAYWHVLALKNADTHIANSRQRIHGVGKHSANFSGMLAEVDKMDDQISLAFSASVARLSRLTGMSVTSHTIEQDVFETTANRLMGIDRFNITQLEEQALQNRPELYAHGRQLLIQREEARDALQNRFPDLNFFSRAAYHADRYGLAGAWKIAGTRMVTELIDSQQPTGNVIESHRLIAESVIAQLHMALVDYALKSDRLQMVRQSWMTASRKWQDPNRSMTAQGILEQLAARLRVDEAMEDCLVAYDRLMATIGADPLGWHSDI